MEFALATLFHSEKGNEIKISKTIISKGPAKAKGAMDEVMDEKSLGPKKGVTDRVRWHHGETHLEI